MVAAPGANKAIRVLDVSWNESANAAAAAPPDVATAYWNCAIVLLNTLRTSGLAFRGGAYDATDTADTDEGDTFESRGIWWESIANSYLGGRLFATDNLKGFDVITSGLYRENTPLLLSGVVWTNAYISGEQNRATVWDAVLAPVTTASLSLTVKYEIVEV